MTGEIPVERGIRCTDCGTLVTLARQADRLVVQCRCDHQRELVPTRGLPEGWTA